MFGTCCFMYFVRYAHLAPAQMAEHAAVVGAMLAETHGTSTEQEGKNGIRPINKKAVTITRNCFILLTAHSW
jgi:hypothetical protein